jgi:hypothetical protein
MDLEALELDFTGDVWYWRGPSPFHFVTVPPDQADLLHGLSSIVTYGWGMIPVRVRLGSSVWATALWPKDGRYVVPIKDAVRRAEGLAPGDIAALQVVVSPSRRRRRDR